MMESYPAMEGRHHLHGYGVFSLELKVKKTSHSRINRVVKIDIDARRYLRRRYDKRVLRIHQVGLTEGELVV